MNQDLTVVILAAGLGTRMKSRKAKVLHEAGGLTLIQHVVNTALALTGPDRVIVVVGHQAERVQQVLASAGVRFAVQSEQKGTGDALEMCRAVVPDQNGRLVVLYGDCPLLSIATLHKLLADHCGKSRSGHRNHHRTGKSDRLRPRVVDESGRLKEIVEEKAATAEQKKIRRNQLRYLLFRGAAAYGSIWRRSLRIPRPTNTISPTLSTSSTASGHSVRTLLHPEADELLGINTRVELAIVDNIFRERKTRELMLSGVTIRRPETVLVDSQVRVGMDSVIEPFAQLLGNTIVGEDSVIGPGCILRNCTVADRVEISAYTIAQDSRIEKGATIGPFARLAAGQSRRGKRPYRKLRRAEEDQSRRRREGRPSRVSRRFRYRGRVKYRRGNDFLQL